MGTIYWSVSGFYLLPIVNPFILVGSYCSNTSGPIMHNYVMLGFWGLDGHLTFTPHSSVLMYWCTELVVCTYKTSDDALVSALQVKWCSYFGTPVLSFVCASCIFILCGHNTVVLLTLYQHIRFLYYFVVIFFVAYQLYIGIIHELQLLRITWPKCFIVALLSFCKNVCSYFQDRIPIISHRPLLLVPYSPQLNGGGG